MRINVSNFDTDTQIEEKIKQKIIKPCRYKVLFINDDETPMQFVVELLMNLFKHSQDSAEELTMEIHTEGSAIVGVYRFEIAEQKVDEATKTSRSQGYPLQIKMEKE